MNRSEQIINVVKRTYRPALLLIVGMIIIEIAIGMNTIYSDMRTAIISIISNSLFQLLTLFAIIMAFFIALFPIVSFLLNWGAYQIARICYSLRVRSVLTYSIQFFSSFKLLKIWFVINFIRIQLRQAFSMGIFGIGMTLYILFLYALILVMVQVPDNIFSSSVDIGILWTFLIGLFGAGIPLAVFFIRYINKNLSGITIREYLKTHVLLTVIIIINVLFAFIFSVGGVYYEDPAVAISAGIFLLFSCVSLVLLYISILIVPFRGKFKGPRRRAAKSVIHRRALSEARSQICDRKINQYTNTKKITDTTPCFKEVTAADLELKTGDHITDIDLKKLRSALDEHQISHFSLSLMLGKKYIIKILQ